ncbi:S-layer homology domain-containing protein [Planococcus koreensis]|uniref:S-layer homology domain-containing protein n=1 Tax=Planococcus koreensis TaxID=112331 RepID=UPI0039FBE5B3
MLLLIMATMVISIAAPLHTKAADDLTGHPYEKEMRELMELGIITGYDDGSIRPEREVTRAEFAKMVILSFELGTDAASAEFKSAAVASNTTGLTASFKDVPMDKWFYNPIMQAAEAGIVTGYPDNTFGPNDPITREQMATMVSRALTAKGYTLTAGKVGYVSQDSINQIPEVMKKGQSYYEASQYGSLIHYLYNHSTGKTVSMGVIGKAPAQMAVGKKYYSWDGANFTDETGNKVTEAHQYFNKLPLYTPSNYSAQELDKFLVDLFPYYNKLQAGKTWTTSPLAGTGKFFKEMESTYKVNALYLMAHAIHESGWGTSKIAQDKFNLYGYGAVDADPYNGAYSYATFRESIEYAAQKINANYHTVTASYYNGSVLGHKGVGMNVRYASDPFWGEKIAGHMYRADINLGGKDINKMALGETTTSGLNFRKDASTLYAPLYKLEMAGIPAVIKGTVQAASNGATWYNVQSENKLYNDAFVHGAYLRELPTAK